MSKLNRFVPVWLACAVAAFMLRAAGLGRPAALPGTLLFVVGATPAVRPSTAS